MEIIESSHQTSIGLYMLSNYDKWYYRFEKDKKINKIIHRQDVIGQHNFMKCKNDYISLRGRIFPVNPEFLAVQ